jgi:hypothetical protein
MDPGATGTHYYPAPSAPPATHRPTLSSPMTPALAPQPSAPPAVSFPSTAQGYTYAQIPYRCTVCRGACTTAYSFQCGVTHAVHIQCYNQEYARQGIPYGSNYCILCRQERSQSPYGFVGGVVIGSLPVIPEVVHTRQPEVAVTRSEAALYTQPSQRGTHRTQKICVCILCLFICVGIITSVWFWMVSRG